MDQNEAMHTFEVKTIQTWKVKCTFSPLYSDAPSYNPVQPVALNWLVVNNGIV